MIMESENITFRKIRRVESLHDISHSTSVLNDTIVSLPNTSLNELNESQTLIELNETIKKLTLQLQTAHQEIDNLNIENGQLKLELQKCETTISAYKKIQFCSVKTSTPSSSRKKKRNTILKELDTQTPALASERAEKTKFNTQNDEIETVKNQKTVTQNEPQHQDLYKVIILSDESGIEIQKTLQTLLGTRYKVLSFSKPCAKINNLVSTLAKEIETLNKNDFVILIGGKYDDNPHELKTTLQNWLYQTKNTNVLITQTPYNKYLNETKLNHDIKFICKMNSNTTFVDMRYEQYIPSRRRMSKYVGQTLLKDILHIRYKMDY